MLAWSPGRASRGASGRSVAQAVARFGYGGDAGAGLARAVLGCSPSSRPGPRRQPKKDRAGTLALALASRREGRSRMEIERALLAEWVPLSRATVWELAGRGDGRLASMDA